MIKKFFNFILNIIFALLVITNIGICADANDSIKEMENKEQIQNDTKNNQSDIKQIENENKKNNEQNNATNQKDLEKNIFNITNDEIVKDINGDNNKNGLQTIQNNKKKYSDYKSLMFNNKNIEDILKLIPKIGKTEGNVDNFLSEESDKQQLIDENNIMIYLDSIMYISKNNWAIWLNGSKITNLNNGDGEIVVTAISPLKALLVWTIDTGRWDIINVNRNIPESRYKITSKGVEIYFTLSPNQTFVPSLDKIVEGKIKVDEPKNSENKDDKFFEDISINKQDILFF